MLPDDMIAVRRAALLVHSLPQGARATVLGQLSEAQRQRLDGLLDELREMNVPPAHDWLRYIDGASDGESAVIRSLRLVSPRRVSRVLEAQPPEVVAAVLGAAQWPWRSAVLDDLAVQQRIPVNALLDDKAGLAEAVVQRLLALCLQAVQSDMDADKDEPVPARQATKRNWLERLF
jgi:hypothetical protein